MAVSEQNELASYRAAEIISLTSKCHTLGESVILSACKKVVKCMFGKDAERELYIFPLFNDTIPQKILESPEIMKHKVQIKIKDPNFALTQVTSLHLFILLIVVK